MSNYGSNTFVIEGANGTEICNKIMKTFDICVELDTRYKIGEVNGKVYTIEKSKTKYAYPDGMEYVFSVWEKDDDHNNGFKRPLAYSWIHPTYIELKDGNLHISESWLNSVGAVEYYIRDVKLHKQTNVYFETNCEADMAGATNDSEGKYFKKCCVLLDGDTDAMIETLAQLYASKDELDKFDNIKMQKKYYELSFDEQLSICKSLEEKSVDIYYDIPKVIETEKFFG